MKKLWIIIIIGVVLRLVLSLVTFHPDIQIFDLAGKLISAGNIFNIYDFSSSSAVFNYPPAIYLYHGLFYFMFSILGLSGINQLNFHLLLLKVPYLIFDLLTGFILLKLFDSPKKSLIAFTLWMFNPISLYATYMMGQFDIIPTFFIVLSIYWVVKNKLEWAALALGFGIAFKVFPLFLIIPLAVFGKSFSGKIKLVVLSLTPYLISILPFLPLHSFRTTALFASQNSKSLYANIPVSGGESIFLFPAFLLFFYLFIWNTKNKLMIWRTFLIPFLLFFIFTHFHPQWLIWITPLLIWDLVELSFKNIIAVSLIVLSWFVSLFFFDPSLTIGMFAPVWKGLQTSPSIWTLWHLNLDYNFSRSIIQTIFAASALYLIYKYSFGKSDVQ